MKKKQIKPLELNPHDLLAWINESNRNYKVFRNGDTNWKIHVRTSAHTNIQIEFDFESDKLTDINAHIDESIML